jgi:DNA-binding CsgD family transcriptional regulator
MLCPVLISRDDEMRRLVTALARARAGHGGVVFLTGDPGVGKSRLAQELASHAVQDGFHALSGRAVESPSPLPFRPITEALMKTARSEGIPHFTEIADYRPALATLVPIWRQSPANAEAEISPLILGEALIRLLGLYRDPGTVLVLEDIHWADPETLAIVQYLGDNLADKQVLCIATLRNDEPSAALDTVRCMHSRRAASLIEVPRLTEREVAKLAARCLEADEVPDAVMRRLLTGCDGLPFAVEEILAAAAASGELVRAPTGWQVNENITTGVPASILGSVRNRLAALGPQVANMIVAAAVLGRQFDWTLLPSLADTTESATLLALDQAHAVQLIEPACPGTGMFRFRHSLTRDAIVSDLLPPELASRSAAAAAVIENAHPGLPGIWCEQAAQLHKAAGNPVRAADLLLEAGRRALRQGALHSAAETLQDARSVLATSHTAAPMLAISIGEALAEALELAGDRQRLIKLAGHLINELTSAGADPRREALVRIRVARLESEHDPGEAARQLTRARSIADGMYDIGLASCVDAAAARYALESGDFDRAEELARRCLTTAERAGLTGWAADVAFESLEVLGRRERLRDMDASRSLFQRAYQIAGGPDFAVRRIRALHELGTLDMLEDGATDRLTEARKLAHQAGAISIATVAELQLANVWSLRSDLGRAMAAARECEESARRIKARRLEALAVGVQALVSGVQGDREGADAAAERAEGIAPGDREVLFATWGHVRVTASLFDDDIPRALQESAAGHLNAGQAAFSALRRAWGYYALLQAVTGVDGRSAVQQARDAGAATGWINGWLAYAEAVLEGRDGDAVRASALAEEGTAWLAPFAPWWNHLIWRLVAADALTDGWGQPVPWMREAAAEFEANGHNRLAAACRGILRRAGQRVPRSGRGEAQVPAQMRRLGVTSREMDVYLLVAQGLSNAEIAARLFISPKTVETHVASLVCKTGQACRRELVAHAARSARLLGGRARACQGSARPKRPPAV